MSNTCQVCGISIGPKAKTCNRHRPTPTNPHRWTREDRPDRSGQLNPNWKGGIKRRGPYVMRLVPQEHPSRQRRSGKPTYVMEHRLAMESHLGRHLNENEYVHHRNGIKDDNRIENLELVTRARHRGEVTCPHCQETFQIH